MFDPFPWLTPEIATLLAAGFLTTLSLALTTSAAALGVGIGVGWLRLSGSKIARGAGLVYVEIFRNVPALVGVIFWAYALPNAFSLEVRRALFFDNAVMAGLAKMTGFSIPYYGLAAACGLILNTSAYLAELFRAGVNTLPREYWETARTLGASSARAFWQVLLPHGLRAAAPALVTRLVHNLKNTALASFVAVPELFKAMQASIGLSFHALELLLLVSVMYWALSAAFAWGLRRLLLGTRLRGTSL